MGGNVILVRHNMNIIPLAEHNFEYNTLVSLVTPESIIIYFSSIIRQTLNKHEANLAARPEKNVWTYLFLMYSATFKHFALIQFLKTGIFSGDFL